VDGDSNYVRVQVLTNAELVSAARTQVSEPKTAAAQ
jgi:hypothetical protein